MQNPAMEKRLQRIRHTPKHMEKMLFVNHKEEQGLQRRLETINSSSRIRSRELDRERIKVRNEWRYNSRLNYLHMAPMLEQIPVLLKSESSRPADNIDPVNVYLLREYRRNSQVIPTILSAVNKGETATVASNAEAEKSQRTSDSQQINGREEFGPRNYGPRRKQRRANKNTSEHDNDSENKDETDDGPDPTKVTNLVREITKIREDMQANKRIELMKSRVSFHDLIREVREKEKRGSESDTFTDGTCVLLRRKMQKMRNVDDLDQGVELTFDPGQGIFKIKSTAPPNSHRKRHSVSQTAFQTQKLPVVPTIRSFSSMASLGKYVRQPSILGDSESDIKTQLEEQERYQIEIKVAIETEKYNRIREKIADFLERNKRKTTIPLILQETDLT